MKKLILSVGNEIGCTYDLYGETTRLPNGTIALKATSKFQKAHNPDEERKVFDLHLTDDSASTLILLLASAVSPEVINTLVETLTKVKEDAIVQTVP